MSASPSQVLLAAVLFGTTGTAQALGPDLNPLAVGARADRRRARSCSSPWPAAVGARRAGPRAPRPARGRLRGALPGHLLRRRGRHGRGRRHRGGDRLGAGLHRPARPRLRGRARLRAAGWPPPRWPAPGVCVLVLGGGAGGAVSAPGVGARARRRGRLRGLRGGQQAHARGRRRARGGDGGGVRHRRAAARCRCSRSCPRAGCSRPGGVVLALYLGADPHGAGLRAVRARPERIGAGETATLTLAEPLTAAALGVIVLGERPGLAAAAGAALVLARAGACSRFRPAQATTCARRRSHPGRPALEARA